MIEHLDNLLRHLFIANIDELSDEAQVRFQPPDKDWRAYVSPDHAMYLNVFLADVRENRKLRSNELTRIVQDGMVRETPAPARIDCHYLITAWSPADTTPAIEPVLDEHALLYQTIGVLMNHESLNPKEIYGEGNLPGSFPQAIADANLPVSILPVEGFGKLPEFWGTVEWRWKPMAYVVVTLPVMLSARKEESQVTSLHTKLQLKGQPETMEESIQIGGTIYDASDPTVRIKDALVRLQETDQSVLTNTRGQFNISTVSTGDYTLEVSKDKFITQTRSIKVPRENKEDETYDVMLTELT